MGACRATHSLWFHARKVIKPYSKFYGRWKCFVDLCKIDLANPYFWHDSFGRYLNKWLICPIVGHRNVHFLSDGGCGGEDRPQHYCFNCESEVDPGIDKIQSNEVKNG